MLASEQVYSSLQEHLFFSDSYRPDWQHGISYNATRISQKERSQTHSCSNSCQLFLSCHLCICKPVEKDFSKNTGG